MAWPPPLYLDLCCEAMGRALQNNSQGGGFEPRSFARFFLLAVIVVFPYTTCTKNNPNSISNVDPRASHTNNTIEVASGSFDVHHHSSICCTSTY